MATLLDAPKSPNPAKVEEFVEKQLAAARRRVRVLDFFMAGLTLAVVSLAFLVAALLVDRYVEMPRGTWWAVVVGYVALAAGYLYLTVFRPDRRQINPYFAATQVERVVPNAKNSLVSWVDFEEDATVPGSIRTAIGQKAARDLRTVDLNRAIENRRIIWLAVAAGVFLATNVVLAILPPTRTELTLDEPKNGDVTVFSNQDVSFQVRVHGRIPGVNDADAVRVRMWYNPDDPEAYEDRPMKPAEDDRRRFILTVPAKQTRNGFHYRVLAGNTETGEYTVTVKIIPEFTGFEVTYEYPAYLKRAPETNNDSNLLAPYGTVATVLATTNREVKHGHIEIEGQARTIDGQLVEGRPDAIQFTLTLEKEGFFRVWFTTPEGDKNQDPARFRLGVIDPKPVVRTFDIAYDYPAYLRFKSMTAADVREPEVEAPRGTNVVLTAKTTRGVKDGKLEIDGQPPIVGELIPDQPTWARFKLPTIDKDATARLTFTPTTGEPPGAPRTIPIRAQLDEVPRVQINKPEEEIKEIAATGSLAVEGLATDDHGVDKMTLRMRLLGAEDRDLAAKPYRGGMSFFRKDDNSWPTRVEYKDFVKLPDVKMPGNPNWKVGPGMEVEYWLEAVDNCTVPKPNVGESKRKRFRVLAPKPQEQPKIDKDNKKLEQRQQEHEKKQDQQNATEKRDVNQQPPKGADQGDKREAQPQDPARGERDPMGKPPEPKQDGTGEPQAGTNPMGDPNHEKQSKEVEQALNNANQENQPGGVKNDTRPPENTKVDPNENAGRPEPKKGPDATPRAENHETKTDPNKGPMEGGAAGESRAGKVDQTKDDKGEVKDAGESQPGMEEPKGGGKRGDKYGQDSDPAAHKPDTKEQSPMPGAPPSERPEKGEARGKPQPKNSDGSDGAAGEKTPAGATKPDQDVTASKDKQGSGEPSGPAGAPQPKDAAANKPQKTPEPGGARPEPKKDELTDKGGARKPPTDDGSAGEEHTPPMGGTQGDQQAKGQPKGGPGTPPPQNGEQGELDRDLGGELDREMNSRDPKIDPKRKTDLERLMRQKENREKIRQKLDQMEQQANKDNDELKKKKVQDLRAAAEQAAKDYDGQKPNQDNVEQLSKQLGSNNERDRKDAEQRIKDWEKDQQAKKDLQEQVDQLKKKDPSAGERVDNAMKKAEQARNQSGGQDRTPKVDEKDLSQMAKDLNGSDEKAKADAQRKLEQIAKDPKAAKDAQEKLQQMADKAQTPKEKQDLKDAAQKAGDMAKEMAANDGQPKTPDPKDVEKAAKDFASADPKTREQAMKDLKKMMQDPKAREEAQKMARNMAAKAKTPEDKQALENAARQMEQLAKEMGDKEPPKVNPQDLKDLANKMAGKDEKAKQEAARKLEEMMKDPKAREQAMKMMEEMAKNGKNLPEDQKALDEALKQAQEMAKNQPPKVKPEDLKDLAQKLNDMSPEEKEKLKQEFEKAMKDPDRHKELEKAAQEMAKNMTPQEKQQFDETMRSLGGDFISPPGKPDPADLRNKLKSAELLLDEFKQKVKDDKFRNDYLKWDDEQIARWMKDQQAAIAAMRKQMESSNFGQDRSVRPVAAGGPSSIKLDPKDSNDGRGGGRYAPPSGYLDPYKRLVGGGQANEPKK